MCYDYSYIFQYVDVIISRYVKRITTVNRPLYPLQYTPQ